MISGCVEYFVNSASDVNRGGLGRREYVCIGLGLDFEYGLGLMKSGEHSSHWVGLQVMCPGLSMN